MSGSVTMRGSVAYASQESWVFSATLRENILFGLPYQPNWYNTVVEACALGKVQYLVWRLQLCVYYSSPELEQGHRAASQWRPDPGGGERGHSQWGTEGQSQPGKVTQPHGSRLTSKCLLLPQGSVSQC